MWQYKETSQLVDILYIPGGGPLKGGIPEGGTGGGIMGGAPDVVIGAPMGGGTGGGKLTGCDV